MRKMRIFLHRYFYKRHKIKILLKNLAYGQLYMLVKNKAILLIENSIMIDLKEEEYDLIKKLDFIIFVIKFTCQSER
jgi:hypothetical protein